MLARLVVVPDWITFSGSGEPTLHPRFPVVVDRVLGNGTVVQDLMTKIAQDRTIMDGVLNLAVQDTAMRSHILALFTGMKMMNGR